MTGYDIDRGYAPPDRALSQFIDTLEENEFGFVHLSADMAGGDWARGEFAVTVIGQLTTDEFTEGFAFDMDDSPEQAMRTVCIGLHGVGFRILESVGAKVEFEGDEMFKFGFTLRCYPDRGGE